MLMAALFTVAKIWKQPTCPSINEWIKMMNNGILLSHKKKEILWSATTWKRPWCWERLKAGEGNDRGWDGCTVPPTRWTWVWVSSGSWWWTGKPDVLQSMGSQRVRHDWVTELNWMHLEGITLCEISGTEKNKHYIVLLIYGIYFFFKWTNKRYTLTYTENKQIFQKGEEWMLGEISEGDQEVQTSSCKIIWSHYLIQKKHLKHLTDLISFHGGGEKISENLEGNLLKLTNRIYKNLHS